MRAVSSSPASTGFFVTGCQTPGTRNACFTRRSSSEWKLIIPARPPGFTTLGSSASSRSSAPSSSFTAIRSAWNTRVAGSMLPDRGTQLRTTPARSAVVANGRFARRSTIRRATRRLCRSSPYSQNTSASPASLIVFTTSAAVAPVVGSSRMSSGPSARKLSPRAFSSIWSELNPRSANTPSTRSMSRAASTSPSWSKFA